MTSISITTMRAAVGSLSSHDGLRSRQYIFAIPELVPVESVYAQMHRMYSRAFHSGVTKVEIE